MFNGTHELCIYFWQKSTDLSRSLAKLWFYSRQAQLIFIIVLTGEAKQSLEDVIFASGQ